MGPFKVATHGDESWEVVTWVSLVCMVRSAVDNGVSILFSRFNMCNQPLQSFSLHQSDWWRASPWLVNQWSPEVRMVNIQTVKAQTMATHSLNTFDGRYWILWPCGLTKSRNNLSAWWRIDRRCSQLREVLVFTVFVLFWTPIQISAACCFGDITSCARSEHCL